LTHTNNETVAFRPVALRGYVGHAVIAAVRSTTTSW